ncbi:MAG: relaxase domain-containing protein [Rhodobacteraceae bacterium]|nr:relaxase domain-containing protein [Paracoccaceae bacterium]
MMSSTPVSAGAAASGYYKSEGYYTTGSEEGDAAAQWFGKAAEALGLAGRIDDPLFSELLNGQIFKPGKDGPEPERLMGRIVEGERLHRPGLDLTFSAPKSVSIAALVFEDERLIKAHDKAVLTAMAYVEQKLVQTRYYKNGDLQVETGGKIIAGLFRHDTSRLLDPQLHTHAVIANMVENSSGRMTAIHNDLIFKAQKLGSDIYRHELAHRVQQAGYTVERVGKDRLIEIKEVPPELTKQFSKRRAEIEAALKERGMGNTAKSAELAALATRTAKQENVDRGALQAGWLAEAEALGLTKDRIAGIRDEAVNRHAKLTHLGG